MLKLDIEIESFNVCFSSRVFFTSLSVAIPPPFMKDEDDQLFMESGIGFRNGREEGSSFLYQPFFPFV